MKKLFTIEEFAITFVAALGYGFSFEIPKILGYPEWLCGVICLVAGIPLEMLERKIVFSGVVQKKRVRRYMALAALVLVCLLAQYFAMYHMNVDMSKYVTGQYGFIIIITLLIFTFRMIIRWYQIRKIRQHYGEGESGFLFDGLLKKSDLDELNRQNQPIRGSYDEDRAVKTRTGVFVGEKYNNSLFFCGIPYAKPPVGERRWKAPELLPESNDVFEAKYLGASAIQVDYNGSLLKHHRQSEDCLTLNICTDGKKTTQKKPVIVIFHHGDFSYGGSADPLLYGENFIRNYPNTVGITFNYRLGIFGFIDFSETPGGEAYPDALNLGLLDQIAALRWIKENISAFGGDPERITVMGFESGAISISLLAASEQAKGLFQKAFIFSGSPLAAYDNPKTSRNLAKKLLQETSTTTMEELLILPTEKLKEVSQKLALDLSGPTRDDKLIPVDVCTAYRNGAASGIKFIIGISNNERQIYKSFVGDQKYEDLISKELTYILHYLEGDYPAEIKAVKAYIEEQTAVRPALEVKAKLVEQFGVLGAYLCAKKLSESGNQVHMLYWSMKPLIENLGSGTVDAVATFLGNQKSVQMYGNVLNQDIAETLQKLFRKFENEDEMRLFNNEIKGISAVDWKAFPQALIVSEKSFQCEPIADKLTDIKCLLKILEG